MGTRHEAPNEERRTYGVARGDITQKDYYSFYLSYRDEFSPIPLGGKLFQQYCVGSWPNIEQCRLDWIRRNQVDLIFSINKSFHRPN